MPIENQKVIPVMGRILLLALAMVFAFSTAGPVQAQDPLPRIALIIGNGSYAAVAGLDNPVPDAQLMADVLKRKGFAVTLLTNAGQIEVNRAIAQFGRALRDGGKDATGLFYYAGHAVQSFGSNFLLPVDATLTDAADLTLVAVPAQAVLRQMFSAKNKTNIVILDACRNNPFVAIPELTDNGLAEMKSPTGTFLAYSTAPGAVALDGLDGNSPFTKALAQEIAAPGIPIEQLFKNVRIEVIKQTGGQQTPWDASSLTGDFFFSAKEELTAEQMAELQMWESVRLSTDPVPILLFIRGYPNSKYVPQARKMLEQIINAELPPASEVAQTPPVAPTVTAEPAPQQNQPAAVDEVAVDETVAIDTTKDQEQLIALAQESGESADYQAYLDAFPNGIYAEFAEFELKVRREKADRAKADALAAGQADTSQNQPVVVAEAASRAATTAMGPELSFDMPFAIGDAFLDGKSIEDLVNLSPLFPPIEGLPETLWKDQLCTNCHQWTKAALCAQGGTYLKADNEEAVTKQHPYGGGFKRNLRNWAEGGCK
jgi:Caspase domain